MSDDIESTIDHHYAAAEPVIAADSSLADLKAALAAKARQWQKRFDEAAPIEAKAFVKKTHGYTTRAAMARMKQAGVVIKFKPTRRMQAVLSSAVAENTKLIKTISAEYLADVAGIVNRGIMAGRDRGAITTELRARYGITQRRASFIAHQESSNATAAMNRTRDLDAGFDEAIWVHHGGAKHPRPKHVKAGRDRLRFKIAEGAPIGDEGQMVLPGQEFRCGCYYMPILKAYND